MRPTHRGTRIEIRKNHLKHNVQALMKLTGRGFFCPMVKANSYGHGVESVIPVLMELGVKNLGVATFDEALELRELGFSENILIFSRTHTLDEAELALEQSFTPVVSRMSDLELFKQVTDQKKKSLNLHVKFDTGIHRMGFASKQSDEVLKFLNEASHLTLSGILTHLSHGEDAGQKQARTSTQIQRILELKNQFSKYNPALHCLNSAALLARSLWDADVSELGSRPGIALYGALKDQRLSAAPVMRVVSLIDHIQMIPKGEGVSYGWTWTAQRDSIIGVVPFGYGDGYPRSLSNKTSMLVRGRKVPQIGTICMDYSLIDLTDLMKDGAVQVEEEVVLLGEQGNEMILPGDLAQLGGTISYEILTSMGLKKNRVEVKG